MDLEHGPTLEPTVRQLTFNTEFWLLSLNQNRLFFFGDVILRFILMSNPGNCVSFRFNYLQMNTEFAT